MKITEDNWINAPKKYDKYEGFVYIITNLMTGKKYIGKKFFWSKRKLRPLKGKKRCRHVVKESDWKKYWGSCTQLTEDIAEYGKENFMREIILLCETRWECAYREAELQFSEEVLFKDEYYNGIINVRLGRRK